VKVLAATLDLLGLSYGAVSLLLETVGVFMSKTLVYYTVQEAVLNVPGPKREYLKGFGHRHWAAM